MAQVEGGSGVPGPRPKIPPGAYAPRTPTPPPAPKPAGLGTYPPAAPPLVYYPPAGGRGGGGGGSGGGGIPSFDYAGLPTQYTAGLGQFVGAPADYYASRGAEKQAWNDYNSLYNTWLNRTNFALTPDDWSNVWGGLNAYRTGYTNPAMPRAWTVSDAFNYLNQMLARTPQAPQVAYLRTGEI